MRWRLSTGRYCRTIEWNTTVATPSVAGASEVALPASRSSTQDPASARSMVTGADRARSSAVRRRVNRAAWSGQTNESSVSRPSSLSASIGATSQPRRPATVTGPDRSGGGSTHTSSNTSGLDGSPSSVPPAT